MFTTTDRNFQPSIGLEHEVELHPANELLRSTAQHSFEFNRIHVFGVPFRYSTRRIPTEQISGTFVGRDYWFTPSFLWRSTKEDRQSSGGSEPRRIDSRVCSTTSLFGRSTTKNLRVGFFSTRITFSTNTVVHTHRRYLSSHNIYVKTPNSLLSLDLNTYFMKGNFDYS